MKRFAFLLLICLFCLSGMISVAPAETITATGSDSGHSASALFSLVGQTLNITLSNTYSNGSNFEFGQTDVLSGVYFDIAGNPALTKSSAILASGSKIMLQGSDVTSTETTDGDVGGVWGFKSGTLSTLSQDYGISSAGLGIFGSSDMFHSGSLPHQQGSPPDGVDYGLMPLDTTNFTHDNFLNQAFIQSSVKFEFMGFTGSLSDISNVRFQYGATLTDFSMSGTVPEPSTCVLLASAAVGIACWMRRRGV
jgi:hypothetical protein